MNRITDLERKYVNEVLDSGFRNSTNGFMVRRLEERFSEYVGAKHAIAMCNGTATLHTALAVLELGGADYIADELIFLILIRVVKLKMRKPASV